jgi:hypothetical protein
MKRVVLIPLLVLVTFCAGFGGGTGDVTAVPGHGVIAIEVVPNPIVAHPVSGTTYDFPFDVVVQETGGHAVKIDRVSADVTALGGLPIASDSYDAAAIQRLGFGTSLPPHGQLRYHFSERESVPDERLFGGVAATLRVDATDDTSTHLTTSTAVTVRR